MEGKQIPESSAMSLRTNKTSTLKCPFGLHSLAWFSQIQLITAPPVDGKGA